MVIGTYQSLVVRLLRREIFFFHSCPVLVVRMICIYLRAFTISQMVAMFVFSMVTGTHQSLVVPLFREEIFTVVLFFLVRMICNYLRAFTINQMVAM